MSVAMTTTMSLQVISAVQARLTGLAYLATPLLVSADSSSTESRRPAEAN
jgi:hypothetical protein